MGQFTQNGIVYEEMPNGKVRVVGYAQGAGAVPLGAPDPRVPLETRKLTNEAAASQFAPQSAQADATIKAAEAANAQQLQSAKTQEAIANAKAAEANAKTWLLYTSPSPRD